MKKSKIIAVHLLNDYSGSPKVFRDALDILIKEGKEVHVLTSKSEGFLSNINHATYNYIPYQWDKNKLLTLYYFIKAQVLLFFKILKLANKEDVIYINSILPFMSAVAGYIKRCSIKYHIHEHTIKPKFLKKIMLFCIEHFSENIFFVSKYLSKQFQFKTPKTQIVYNALSEQFTNKILPKIKQERFTILLLGSFKAYKGVYDFVEFAKLLPDYDFILVINGLEKDILSFKEKNKLKNLTIYYNEKNVHPFYQKADVVLNLSHPDGWIETFGMTVLEAMQYGIPVIVPEIGGVTELVDHNVNGYQISIKNKRKIIDHLKRIDQDKTLYENLSIQCKIKAMNFSIKNFEKNIITAFK